MHKISTREKIEVMQAFADGKDIQMKSNVPYSKWQIILSPNWNWFETKYRVKPEEENIDKDKKMNSDILNNLYMFEYDHDWGQRGNRRNSIIYFSATDENKWDMLQ